MKFIAITQRAEVHEPTGERRDSLDQQWSLFFFMLGVGIFPVPNQALNLYTLLKNVPLAGIVLSGGGDLSAYSTQNLSPEREERERDLIAYAVECAVPLIGICRGMQALAHYFGTPSRPLAGHDAERHTISINPQSKVALYLKEGSTVNSYHRFAPLMNEIGKDFIVSARCGDIVEGIEHAKHALYGIMWHPEREKPFRQPELAFFKDMFKL